MGKPLELLPREPEDAVAAFATEDAEATGVEEAEVTVEVAAGAVASFTPFATFVDLTNLASEPGGT